MIRKPIHDTDAGGAAQVECDAPGKPFCVHPTDRFCEICRPDQAMPAEWASIDRRWTPVQALKSPAVSLHDTLNPHRVVVQVWKDSPVNEVQILWPDGRLQTVRR